MLTIREICEALKQLGIEEVLLSDDKGTILIEFNGFNEGYFKIKATNIDFEANAL